LTLSIGTLSRCLCKVLWSVSIQSNIVDAVNTRHHAPHSFSTSLDSRPHGNSSAITDGPRALPGTPLDAHRMVGRSPGPPSRESRRRSSRSCRSASPVARWRSRPAHLCRDVTRPPAASPWAGSGSALPIRTPSQPPGSALDSRARLGRSPAGAVRFCLTLVSRRQQRLLVRVSPARARRNRLTIRKDRALPVRPQPYQKAPRLYIVNA
jgi:hypothetical protein